MAWKICLLSASLVALAAFGLAACGGSKGNNQKTAECIIVR